MNRRRERIGTFLMVAGLVAAFFAAVHLPGRNARSVIHQEIAAAEADISRSQAVIEQFRAVQTELSLHNDYLLRSTETFTDSQQVLANVHRLAIGSRLKIIRLEPETVRARSTYEECPFRLEFRGSLSSLASFLHGLERDQRVYAVEELEIRRPGNEANLAELEGVYRFAVFSEHQGVETLSKEVRGPSRL